MSMLMRAEESYLIIVDVQENLTPVMTDPRRIIRGCSLLMRAAGRLAVPLLASEQYPRGLGPTIFDLREYLPPEGAMAKLHFSCADDQAIVRKVEESGRSQVVIAGVEAHVCVMQTALGFREKGYDVFVVADASGSRRAESEAFAWERIRSAGASVVSVEMALFEWLRVAGTAEFKELSALIK